MKTPDLALGLIWYIVFLFSTTCHEASHALAGPAANFTLMLVAGIAIRAGIAMGYLEPPQFINYTSVTAPAHSANPTFAATALSILFVLNLLLGTFNLLPVPPLDGHAGIMLFMGENAAHHYLDWVQQSGYAMLGLIVAWYAFDRIFGVIFTVALRLLYPGIRYG